MNLSPVLLMGPTASGKSALALALAARIPAEIISVDSAQVYRGMDIGTAKPDATERAQVPHHLLDILDPVEPYSAARFVEDAQLLIAEIRGRGKRPLLVGGSMLYHRALTGGLSDLPPADARIRARLEAEALREGWPALHARLQAQDPVTAARLHPNDQQRIQRALEIIESSGQPVSALRTGTRVQDPGWVKIALEPPLRAELHRRIGLRFHQMMERGFLQEVRNLHGRGDLHPDLPSIRSVGYRQLWAHLEGLVSLPLAMEQGIAATRQFAKRQITWLRSESAVHRLDPDSPRLLDQALALLQ